MTNNTVIGTIKETFPTTKAIRAKFVELAFEEFPTVGEPGVVWVLTHALGWDWETIKKVDIGGFDRKGYRILVEPDFTHRPNHYPSTIVTRKWTKDEKRKLADFWWLLGL